MEDKLLRIVYTLFLSIIVVLFIGVGISTFYPGPASPDYPITSSEIKKSDEQLAKDAEAQKQYEIAQKEYNRKSESYNRDVAIITLISAVVLLAVSLFFEKRNRVVANGVLLGAVFTLLYSVGRGFASDNDKLTFVTVTVGLAIAIFLGYRRFAPAESTQAKLAVKKR